jgi:hypothetical protein
MVSRSDKRICKANEIASHETANFEKLTTFSNEHPYIMFDIMREYRKSPDFRFGDTLLMFCNAVDHRRISVDSSNWKFRSRRRK